MKPNKVKRLLQAGKPAVGVWLNIPSPATAEAMASLGWDFLTVDVEHGAIDLETIQNMFIAIGSNGAIPLARITWNDHVVIKRILDAGAFGVVVPMVCSPAEAEAAVKACKYPPEGIRGAGGGRWRYSAGSNYMEEANDEIMCVVMIEHPDAVRQVEQILSVDGVDACFIGPNDLSWNMGLHGRRDDPRHAEAIQRVLEAGKKVGKPTGIHCLSAEEVNQRIEQGFQFLACQNDIAFMMGAATTAFKTIRR